MNVIGPHLECVDDDSYEKDINLAPIGYEIS